MIRCAWFLTDLRGGGAERLPLVLSQGLTRTDLTVVLLKNVVEHALPDDGPRVTALSDGTSSLTRMAVPILGRAVRAARRADILVAGLEWAPTFFTVASGALARKPVVATVHIDLRRFYTSPTRHHPQAALRWSLARTRAVVAVSEDVRESLLDLGVEERKITVVHNPVPPWDSQRTWTRPLRRIVTVGSLKPTKGVDVALAAAARLLDHDIEWEFVGDGPERSALTDMATRLGIAGMVRFSGFRPDVRPTYESADIFVLPSRVEGFPLVMTEAMAAGLPIVSTRCCSGVEDLLGDAGILVPVDDPDAMAEAIRSLLGDRERARRLGEAAAHRAKRFDVRTIADRYEGLFEAVLGHQV